MYLSSTLNHSEGLGQGGEVAFRQYRGFSLGLRAYLSSTLNDSEGLGQGGEVALRHARGLLALFRV